MRFLSDLANDYERWASQNENSAAAILGYLPRYNPETREKEADRASVLLYEAEIYRVDAARLRSRRERWASSRKAAGVSIECPREPLTEV